MNKIREVLATNIAGWHCSGRMQQTYLNQTTVELQLTRVAKTGDLQPGYYLGTSLKVETNAEPRSVREVKQVTIFESSVGFIKRLALSATIKDIEIGSIEKISINFCGTVTDLPLVSFKC